VPHRQLSKPFRALELDLQQRVNAASAAAAAAGSLDTATASTVFVEARSGRAQDRACRQLARYGAAAHRHAAAWEQDDMLQVSIEAQGRWNAVAFWFQLDMGPGAPQIGSWQTASDGGGSAEPAVGTSWQQSVQYLDGRTVEVVRLL
jgi:hypothetical protein